MDVPRGVPATGLAAQVFTLTPERRLVAEGTLGASGLLDQPTVQGHGVAAGAWKIVFEVGAWLCAAGHPDDQTCFLDVLPFRFVVTDVDAH